MRKRLGDDAKKILAARKSAAIELKAIDGVERSITDYSVRRLAAARLFADNVELRIASGDPVTSTEVKAADEMVEQARQAAKDRETTTIAVRFVDGSGAPVIGADGNPATRLLTLGELREQAKAEGRLDPVRYSNLPPPRQIDATAVEVGSDTPDAKPHSTTAPIVSSPIVPQKKDLAALNRSFHDGGFTRQLSMADGWFSNLGGMARRRNEGRTIYEPLPNPTRAT